MSLGCQSDATRMSLHVTSCFDMARTSCRGCLGCLVVKIGESSERNRQIGSKRLKSVNLGGHRDKQFKSKSGAMQFLPLVRFAFAHELLLFSLLAVNDDFAFTWFDLH